MKSVKRVIVNELGNSISFEVTRDSEELTVYASGPNSEVEHTWTLMEARVLDEMLSEALS